MNTSNKAMFVEPCLNAFKSALEEIKPSSCVQTALHLRSNQLSVNGRTYHIKNNVHLVAIGKAAPGMVEGAESVLKEYFNQGIASVPSETLIPQNLRTQFLTGAKNNLPDEEAIQNVKKIEQFIQLIKNKHGEQLILVC
jgi:glycerate-2-kinase